MQQVEELLDDSIAAEGHRILPTDEVEDLPLDLSQIDFEMLQEKFQGSRKRTGAEKLRVLFEQKVQRMVRLNNSRTDFLEKFQKTINEYNTRNKNVEEFFEELVKFAQCLTREKKRAVSVGRSEEELALFDVLTQPEQKLTNKQENEGKEVCQGNAGIWPEVAESTQHQQTKNGEPILGTPLTA